MAADVTLAPAVRQSLLLDRARQLVDAGAHNAQAAEVAAVHDAIWPAQAPICPTLTCRAVLGRAFFTIKRWLDQQDNSPSISTSSTVSKNTSTARFHSDTTTLFPHGLGVAYSNDNLTDSAARYIIKHDPDAAQFFKVLPPEAKEGEDDEQPTETEQPTATAESAPASQQPAIDYDLLASKVADELQRRAQPTVPATDGQPALTASAGGAPTSGDASTDTHEDGRPVALSRQNHAQLVTTYTTELGTAPAEDLLNDDLRAAITQHRAGKQDPE